ncbi:late embryogenesis abundant protein At5g17165-like [Trifolium pratense]|uniref:late embryogenesis abundant protein At5g17165-like n=1 Tax=Trifolium pratense TaxID=57577 RepID=UPI000843F7E6|nr:late embryogenesis abundant protein At5g17165-like [Trifolium pratense]
MAANSNVRSITGFGKQLINQIWRNNSASPPLSLASRRAAYSSVYDKNADDHIRSEPVPDDVIQSTQSTKYWAPHPHTGVFGPPGEHSTDASAAAASSVLEEKAWFRPSSLEDLEKPHPTHPQ